MGVVGRTGSGKVLVNLVTDGTIVQSKVHEQKIYNDFSTLI